LFFRRYGFFSPVAAKHQKSFKDCFCSFFFDDKTHKHSVEKEAHQFSNDEKQTPRRRIMK